MTNAMTTHSWQSGSNRWTTRGLDKYPTYKAEPLGSGLIGFQDRFTAPKTVVPSLTVLSANLFPNLVR